MSIEDRGSLLDAFEALAHLDPEMAEPLRTFLPQWRHARSFSSDVLVVLGARGSGKTALFKLANDARTSPKLRAFFGNQRIPDASWFDAFSQGTSRHPEVGTMEAFGSAAGDIALRAFWVAHLLRVARGQLADPGPLPEVVQTIVTTPVNEISTWAPLAEANLGPVFTALDAVDRALGEQKQAVVALYDNLDRIAQFTPEVRRRYVRALLSLWLSLANRYQNLRGKIFLRDDLFEASELDFTDATKLRARSETLTWETEELYRLVARHVVNVSEPRAAEAARRLLGEVPGLVLEDRGEFGWMPREMGEDVYKAFVSRIAGKVIGRGVIKGATHSWIVGRLKDAQKRITPRAMLWFFGYAAEAAKERAPGRGKVLYASSDLLKALKRTSRDRAQEVLEEYGLAKRLENLRGQMIPFSHGEIVRLLGMRRQGEPIGIPEQGEPVLKELLRLGILREEEGGSIDVPDIYRYGFEIGPDYATAWRDLLEGKEKSTRVVFEREAPIFSEIWRSLDVEWSALGTEEIKRKDYAEARRVCERALEAARSADDRRVEAHALTRLAGIDADYLSDFVTAKGELERALGLYRKAGDRHGEAFTLLQSGRVALNAGERETARPFLEAARQAYEQESNWAGVWNARVWLAESAEQLDSPSAAVRNYVESIRAARRGETLIFEKMSWWVLSSYAERLGRYDEALRLRLISAEVLRDPDTGVGQELPPDAEDLIHRLGISPNRVAALRQEALDAYARDKGHSLLVAAFPEVTFPPFD